MAATLVGYGAVLFELSGSWRMHYLAPLHMTGAVQFHGGGDYGDRRVWVSHQPVIMSQTLGWPDGRLLSDADHMRPAAWMRLHHIVM